MSCVRVQDMPLMQAKKPNPTPPTALGSTTLHQETLTNSHSKHDTVVDCYSDDGYPTLPRPKVILSLRHSDAGTWSRKQASLLQTVPVRIHGELKRARSLSLDTATTPNNLPIRKALQPENRKLKDSKQSNSKPRIVRSKSLSTSGNKLSNGQPASKSPLLIDCRDPSLTPPALPSPTQDMSTNHSRVQARKEADKASLNRSKKSRKIGRAITFSFGAGSDKKRRSLGFLGKAKDATDNDYGEAPASPILTTRKNNKLTSSWSNQDFHQRTIIEETDSASNYWAPAPVYPHQEPVLKNHFGSCRDFHSIDETEEVRHQPRVPLYIPVREDTRSPDISPTLSEFSSRQNSFESLSLSLRSEPMFRHSMSTPPSRSHSPVSWKLQEPHTHTHSRQRKLSDPQLSPDLENSDEHGSVFENGSSPVPRNSNLKKRNTFCVRETKLTHKPGWHEMRHHVVRFLLETEQSYVQSLRTVIKVYMEPLHRPQASALIEPHLAKDIFHQIPEVYQLHEKFLGQVAARVEGWTPESKIGDVFVNTFSKCHLMDVYRKFIGNFMRAKSAIEIAKQARPVFGKFLEQRAKDSKGRFTLDDLLIKPVQRIPRYVLFIKDLLKHTSMSHSDHAPLQQALGELTALAERVNTSERERGRLEEQRELIAAVDGLAQLIKPQSRFIRHDMVAEIKGNVQKRDRFLILFSDMVVCACARRKSTGFIRGSLISLNSPFNADALKHTVKWYVPLTKVSRAQLQGPAVDKRKQNTIEKMLENLKKDEKTLALMMEQSITLHTPHQSLNTTLKNLQADVRERMSEKRTQLENLPVESGRIDLVSYASPSPTQYSLVFPSQRIRSSWEVDFIKAKSDADQQAPPNTRLAPPTSPVPHTPTELSAEFNFVRSMVLQSGRLGTELTCGSIGLPVDCESSNCLWTCAGDISVGQVSIVDLLPSSPSHTLANITVSDSRITCIAAVPSTVHTPPTSEVSLLPTISVGSFGSSSSLSSCSDRASNLDEEVSNLEESMIGTRDTLDSMSGQIIQPQDRLLIDMKQMRSNSAPPIPDPSLAQEPLFAPPDIARFSPLTLRAPDSNLEGYGSDHCMWLGTENGQLFVYSPGDNLRSRSNRQCVQLEAPVTSIRYHDSFVYVGLSNGVLTVFDASNAGLGPVSRLRVTDVPVVSCVPLVSGVGVCSGGTIFLLAPDRQSATPLATLPSGQVISGAVSVEGGVWVSVRDSPTVHLLHVPSGEILTSVDCTLTVMTMLQGYNPIIRQHKSSSLQVTSLCATPTHLVAGTSAGVTITFPLPLVQQSLEPHPLPQTHTPIALPTGHVGPVKFLTSIIRSTGTLLVTGGNGCEDLASMTVAQDVPETCNCLLLWSIQ